jgi:hypothetical protein
MAALKGNMLNIADDQGDSNDKSDGAALTSQIN